MRTRDELIGDLRVMLHEAIVAKGMGASHTRLGRAQGLVDGYMRALLDAGIATRAELLTVVAEERSIVDGPAIGACSTEHADSEAA